MRHFSLLALGLLSASPLLADRDPSIDYLMSQPMSRWDSAMDDLDTHLEGRKPLIVPGTPEGTPRCRCLKGMTTIRVSFLHRDRESIVFEAQSPLVSKEIHWLKIEANAS